MDFATTTIYMFTLCFVFSIGAIVFLEVHRSIEKKRIREELIKKHPELKDIL